MLVACSNNSNTVQSVAPTVRGTAAPPTTTIEPVPVTVDIAERAADADAGDPQQASLPDITDASATRDYLDTQPELARLNEIATALAASKVVDTVNCATAATGLDTLGTPAELQSIAAGVPDPAVAELFVGLVSALSRVLTSCADTGVDQAAVAELAFQSVVVARVIAEI